MPLTQEIDGILYNLDPYSGKQLGVARSKYFDFDDEIIRGENAIKEANSLIGRYDSLKKLTAPSSNRGNTMALTNQQRLAQQMSGGVDRGFALTRMNQGDGPMTPSELEYYHQLSGNSFDPNAGLRGMNTTNDFYKQKSTFLDNYDKKLNLLKGLERNNEISGDTGDFASMHPESYQSILDWDKRQKAFNADPKNQTDEKTDWLGWSQVASGLGQAFANYKQSQAAMAKIPLLRDELNFRKASFKDQQGDRRTLHNNAINQQIGLLKSDFFADPTRAASLRTLPA